MSGLIIGLIGKSGLKYALVFGIGSYIVFIICVISLFYKWEMENVWISGVLLLVICTFVDLIIGSFEVSFLRYVVIVIIGIGLIFVFYWNEDRDISYTGIVLIIVCCIMSGLIIGLIGKSGLKYALVFGIGSYIVFIICVISLFYKWEMENVWISGVLLLVICTFVDLIIGSFEVSFLKYVVIGMIGIVLIVLCFVLFYDECVIYTGIVLIIICCIMSGLIIGLIGKSGWLGFLILGIASYIAFIIFIINAICKENNMTTFYIMGPLVYIYGVDSLYLIGWVYYNFMCLKEAILLNIILCNFIVLIQLVSKLFVS